MSDRATAKTVLFVADLPARSRSRSLLNAGLQPRSAQYGDPQDFGANQFVVVLERTDTCESDGVTV